MRAETSITLLSITMAFLSGLLVLWVKNSETIELTTAQVQQEIYQFSKRYQPVLEFDPGTYAIFIDPSSVLPQYDKFYLPDLKKFMDAEECNPAPQTFLTKVHWWQGQVCKGLAPDLAFFEKPPYFHPSGKSYAYLALKKFGANLDLHKYLHVLDLAEVNPRSFDSPLVYLKDLDWKELYQFATDDRIILSDKYVFIKRSGEREYYDTYEKKHWDEFWKDSTFRPGPVRSNQLCYFRDSSICWNYDATRNLLRRWNILTISLVVSVLLTLWLLWLLIGRVRQRQLDEAKLKFSLEMLAHEIRTPLTNMELNLEPFRSGFVDQKKEDQTHLLRLFDQVERLKRIVATSQSYLRKDLGTELIQTNFVAVASLDSFVDQVLEPYLHQIEIKYLGTETPLTLDPYWTSICMKNVVENALTHGEKPVKVVLEAAAETWSFSVLDHGTKPFTAAKSTKGLGLGLKLVEQIMGHLKGKLTISQKPTAVRLEFKRTR